MERTCGCHKRRSAVPVREEQTREGRPAGQQSSQADCALHRAQLLLWLRLGRRPDKERGAVQTPVQRDPDQQSHLLREDEEVQRGD